MLCFVGDVFYIVFDLVVVYGDFFVVMVFLMGCFGGCLKINDVFWCIELVLFVLDGGFSFIVCLCL